MAVKREKIHFSSIDEILGAPAATGDEAVEIRIADIYPFVNHPFRVVDDEKMNDLVESIRKNGIITPVIVRPDDEGTYEMISGHRRMHAAKLAGLVTLPAIIKLMTDDEAVIAMVDANVQRDEILPSERAYSLKMKFEAMKHQGERTDLSFGTQCRKNTTEEIGEQFGLKDRQVRKYIRLTYLIPDLMKLVDNKRIQITMAVEISYFDLDIQKWIYEYISENGFLKQEQVNAIKNCRNIDSVTQTMLISIMNEAIRPKKVSGTISISSKTLDKYFDASVSIIQREKIILSLLDRWRAEQEG